MTVRILFVHNGRERFVLDDLMLLSQVAQVADWYQPRRQFNPVRLAQMVRSHDLVFGWFASWHTLLPVLLARAAGKPAVVVVGGYDTARLPEAGYGSQRGGLPRWVARTVISQATHLIVNSQAARREAIANGGANPAKISVIYHGVNPLPLGPEPRERLALTVGGLWRENLLRKGMLPFVQAAALLPDVRFVLAGRWHDDSVSDLRHAGGSNVEFTGFLPDGELAALYGRAAVYVQASLHEGFGLSVAEAMTTGCIPVTTRCGSLPEVVGDCGIYLNSNEPTAIASGVAQALAMTTEDRQRARQQILECFPMRKRVEALQQMLQVVSGVPARDLVVTSL